MSTRRVVIAAAVVIIGGCAVINQGTDLRASTEAGTAPTAPASAPAERPPRPTPTPTKPTEPAKKAQPAEQAEPTKQVKPKQAKTSRSWRVTRVVDGDTIDAQRSGRSVRVRILGIDTPERGDCGFGPATSFATRFLMDQEVALVGDPSQDQRDRYGRLLAYVDRNGKQDYGLAAIKAGYAKAYVYDAPVLRHDDYTAAETRAEKSDRGNWAACDRSRSAPDAGRASSTDPRFDTCREANSEGFGPYVEGKDPEYEWYDDRDSDGVVCERR